MSQEFILNRKVVFYSPIKALGKLREKTSGTG